VVAARVVEIRLAAADKLAADLAADLAAVIQEVVVGEAWTLVVVAPVAVSLEGLWIKM